MSQQTIFRKIILNGTLSVIHDWFFKINQLQSFLNTLIGHKTLLILTLQSLIHFVSLEELEVTSS